MAWDPHRPPHKAQPPTNSTPFARRPPVSFPSRRTVSSLLPHHTITPHHASPSRRIIPPPQTSAPQRLGQAAPDRHAAPRSIMSRVIHQIAQSHCAANTTSRCITSHRLSLHHIHGASSHYTTPRLRRNHAPASHKRAHKGQPVELDDHQIHTGSECQASERRASSQCRVRYVFYGRAGRSLNHTALATRVRAKCRPHYL